MKLDRRQVIRSAAWGAAALTQATSILPQSESNETQRAARSQPFITARDGTRLFVQDWGSGRPIIFLSAWTFQSNVWGHHMAALTAHGFRCVAPDRRGHGRSDASATGYDLDTLVDDVSRIMDQLDLRDAVLVAHSMGSFEAVRYLASHGSSRVARLVMAAPSTPFSTRTADNPEGWPAEAIEAQTQLIARDFPRWIEQNEGPFFTPDTSQGTRTWIKNMMTSLSLPVALATRSATLAVDVRPDLAKISCPTLIVHGDKDVSAPIAVTGARTARLIRNAKLIVYPDAPHGIILTHQERFLSDLLTFIKA
ncbi:alpha/beta fold hydrolase [Occallatibacter riparius]|uniref:Alpha/beta hydrolase n=1 Tax=Occallatibacter riparius TaxID=1002689 RepID=A0A9J7BVX1_9BACT|nr:alpha/beta hydrolase [Occallatibacter riparius]UWZ86784.1 alpha/beta hydrolase [Occallatibacter riparius]